MIHNENFVYVKFSDCFFNLLEYINISCLRNVLAEILEKSKKNDSIFCCILHRQFHTSMVTWTENYKVTEIL